MRRLSLLAILLLVSTIVFSIAGLTYAADELSVPNQGSPADGHAPAADFDWSTSATVSAEDAARISGIHTIYFCLMNHENLSYNTPEDDNVVSYKQTIDDVIKYCDESPDFHWTCEGVWMVERWIEQTPEPEKVEHFMELVRKGQIEVTAGYVTLATGAYSSEQLRRMLLPGMKMKEKYNIPIDTLVNNEIAGYSQAMPQICAQAGVKYFYTAMGWGILGGGTTIPLGDMPFRWEGLAGEKALTWVQRESYAENFFFPHFARFFHSKDIKPGETDEQYMNKMISLRLLGFMREGYKKDAIMTSTGNDNMAAGSTYGFLPKIREWNATHKYPKIVFATPRMFFKHIEEKYGPEFPVHKGDWSCAWIGGTQLSRWTRNNLLTAESLSNLNVLLGGKRSLHENFWNIYHEAYEACGSHFGGVDEHQTFSYLARRNFIGPEHMRIAASETATVLHRGVDQLASKIASTSESLVVFNPTSWKRTDPVTITMYPKQLKRDFMLRDAASNKAVPVEFLGDQPSVTFVASDLPPMGYKVFAIDRSAETSPETKPAAPGAGAISAEPAPPKPDAGNEIENAYYKVVISPENGTLASIIEKESGRELLNKDTKYPLGRVSAASHMEGFFGAPPGAVLPAIKPSISRTMSPVRQVLRADWERGAISSMQVTLWSDIRRLDLAFHVEGKRLPKPDKDNRNSFFLSFPFNIDSKGAHLGYESPGGWLMPSEPEGRLPGAGTGLLVPQGALDLRGNDGWGVQFASIENGPVSLGNVSRSLNLDGTRESTIFVGIGHYSDGPTGKGYGVDELVLAGTPAELDPNVEKEMTIRFAIGSSSGDLDVVQATRFGRQLHLPLYGRDIAPNPRGFLPATAQSFFAVEPGNVALEVLKRPDFANGDDVLVRVQEIAGKPAEKATLKTAFKVKDTKMTLLDEKTINDKKLLSEKPIQFSLKPGEFATLRLAIEPWTSKKPENEQELTIEKIGPEAF